MEIYIVKQGDTLENIASLYNVSVNEGKKKGEKGC